MAKLDDIKGAVIDTIGVVAGKTRDLAGNVADRAKDVSRMAKLNFEISSEKETIKKAYIEIGKLYYETYKDDPDGFFVQLCDEITMANDSIKAKEDEIAAIKASYEKEEEPEVDADIVVEFDEIVAEAEAAAAPEAEPEAEPESPAEPAPEAGEAPAEETPAGEEKSEE